MGIKLVYWDIFLNEKEGKLANLALVEKAFECRLKGHEVLTHAAEVGRRRVQEDRSLIASDKFGGLLMAVADGHGSSEVAEDLMEALPRTFSAFRKKGVGTQLAFRRTFAKLAEITNPHTGAGSTLSVVYVVAKRNMVHVATVGDSPVVVWSRGTKNRTFYSNLHNIYNAVEVARAVERNAVATGDYFELPNGANGGIQLSRCFGDSEYPFVSREPEMFSVKLDKESSVLLGTDGLLARYAGESQVLGLREIAEDLPEKSLGAENYVRTAGGAMCGDNVTAILWRT